MFNTKSAPMVNNSNQVQKGEKVNEVYKTYDLSIFKSIGGNRVPNLQHIRRLSVSVKEYGMKCNPIIVNEKFEVIDGQHRLEAARDAETFVYYIVIEGYTLSEVHTLNLNQKNWTKKDFMDGYAGMGVPSYVELKRFSEKNDDYTFNDCIALCSNITTACNMTISNKFTKKGIRNSLEIFEEGTWKGKDFNLAQEYANKIRMVKPYYNGYNRTFFVGVMISLFKNEKFDFNDFMHKVRLQPTALVDCANRDQYRTLIEDIYNYRSRNKISLRY
jgi:hypothetical protein